MLDFIFYPKVDRDPVYVEVSESLYEWLARSVFGQVGQSQVRSILLDGEALELPVVELGGETRKGLSHFLRDQIIEESDRVLRVLDEVRWPSVGLGPSKSEVQEMTYRLRKFQELRKCVENPAFSYLQRV
jgi:hypothetical protein